MEGLEGLGDGVDRLNEGFDRLEFTDGVRLGVADLNRLDIWLCRPLLERGTDGVATDGLRLTCGLGCGLNDLAGTDPLPRFITEGRDGICGVLAGIFLTLDCEAAASELLRPRDWPKACGPANNAIPTTKATADTPPARLRAPASPAVREWFLSFRANIVILLSPRRHRRTSTPRPADRRHSTRST